LREKYIRTAKERNLSRDIKVFHANVRRELYNRFMLALFLNYLRKLLVMCYLSFVELERGGFGEILPKVMIFIITEGNISPNSPLSRSINKYIIPKIKSLQVEKINLPHTFVNMMFYFWIINASIVAFFRN
jgi:hypothetical protein